MGSTWQTIDQGFARLVIAVHIYYLCVWGKQWTMFVLAVATGGLYAVGRLLRERLTLLKAPTPEPDAVPVTVDSDVKRQIGWLYDLHTVAHVSFRYCAFWLITYTHSFACPITAGLEDDEWQRGVGILSCCYLLSIGALLLLA
jgi:hypothetical protein